MIGYVTIGTNDFERAVAFYETLLGEQLGAQRVFETERVVAWSTGPDKPGLGVCKPFDGSPATIGNGTMVAIAVDSPEKVQQLYQIALDNGGTDEGEPGIRFGQFYAAYFRDPDGNKLNAFCFLPE